MSPEHARRLLAEHEARRFARWLALQPDLTPSERRRHLANFRKKASSREPRTHTTTPEANQPHNQQGAS